MPSSIISKLSQSLDRKLGANVFCCVQTDDVGVFGSPLSSEYLLAAQHFDLQRTDLIDLARQAASVAFAGRGRLLGLIDKFEAGLHK